MESVTKKLKFLGGCTHLCGHNLYQKHQFDHTSHARRMVDGG